MTNLVFLACLTTGLGLLYTWGFRNLADERWQVIGCLPLTKQPDGQWKAVNLTYYGFFNATACVLSALLVFVLLSATGMPTIVVGGLVGGILLFCVAAAKLVAGWVEKKPHTFSVGGASFAGFMVMPWLLMGLNQLPAAWSLGHFSVMRVMAGLAIGYALGEGVGRLACISFGCCYGRRLDQLPALLGKLLRPFSIRFTGATKKIAYAHNMTGFRTVAVQAMTTVLYSCAALAGTGLFLFGHAAAALVVCVLTTQIWRILSELLRADFRGHGRVSAYQIMAGLICLNALGLFVFFPIDPAPSLNLADGLIRLWHPGAIVLSQVVWILLFLYMGLSRTTAATINVYVRTDRI